MDIGKNIDFDFFLRFINGIQEFLGSGCEIVIHDYRKGYDHTTVYLVNGELSGRRIGDPPRGAMFFYDGKDIEPFRQSKIFFYFSKDKKLFKSCTNFICDENNTIIGSVCVNLDVTELMRSQEAVQNLVQYKIPTQNSEPPSDIEITVNNIDDVLNYYLKQGEALVGKPMSLMNKEEKVKTIGYLDQKGVFKVSKAGLLLCDTFQISKFTLYNYLEEARNNMNSESFLNNNQNTEFDQPEETDINDKIK